jgi:hypothetical protein
LVSTTCVSIFITEHIFPLIFQLSAKDVVQEDIPCEEIAAEREQVDNQGSGHGGQGRLENWKLASTANIATR